MEPSQFIRVLQLSDSFFPVGAFAYSDGLETAAGGELIRDAESLGGWMNHFLDAVFIPCDGLALRLSMRAFSMKDFATLRRIDEELTAIKSAAAVRAASASVGKRFLAAYTATANQPLESPELPHGNAAVTSALVFAHLGVSDRDALLTFGYNRLTGMVSAGLRLISIGQNQGQALLTNVLGRLPYAVDRILEMENEPLRSFSPQLDIQQMNHRYVYSRLFRS